MKILELRKKIILNSATAAVAVIVFCGSLYYNMYQNASLQQRITNIDNDTSRIQNQSAELQSKTIDIKKYMAVWQNLSDNKKNTNGIKMDEVNTILTSLAAKYNISNPAIKANLPEQLNGGVFNATTILTFFTNGSLTFKAVDDGRAIAFVNEFLNAIPGYTVISTFDLKKDNKSYSAQDLVAISTGNGTGIVDGSINFFWYSFRNKNPEKDKVPTIKPDQKTSAKPETKTN